MSRTLWVLLGGWLLAVGGFSLDFFADRRLDLKGPRSRIRRNPLADGPLRPGFGLAFSVVFLLSSLGVILISSPRSLSAWAAILLVIVGLALHVFETPFARAFTLGLLQALYITMGGLAGRFSGATALLAGVFFFAMFGGRGMIDIRDFPQDDDTEVQTLPKKYGIQTTAYFTGVSLLAAFILSFTVYLTGEFGPIYLYLDIGFIVIGTACAMYFTLKPGPELAAALTPVFMMGEGTLICLAMILGSIYR